MLLPIVLLHGKERKAWFPYDGRDRPDRPSRFKIFLDDPDDWGDW